MTIDEAIINAREVASRRFDDRVHCIKCADEHKQLAEWLEELKDLRDVHEMFKLHDLRKNPNDFPDNSREVLVYENNGDIFVSSYSKFYDLKNPLVKNRLWNLPINHKQSDVIAWREIEPLRYENE